MQHSLKRVGLIIVSLSLVLLCALQAFALWRTPSAWSPAAIDVRLADGQALQLGRAELAAPQAALSHIMLRRDAGGAWWLRNVSANKQVLLQQGGDELRVRSHVLETAQQFRIGGQGFTVNAVGKGRLDFSDAQAQAWRYDGAVLYRAGVALAACPDASLHSRAVHYWNRLLPAALQIARPLLFGGNLYCENQLGLANTALGAASVMADRKKHTMMLMPASASGEHVSVFTPTLARDAGDTNTNANANANTWSDNDIDVRRQEQALAGIGSMVLGHTRFQLEYDRADATHLRLRPSLRVALFTTPAVDLPPQVQWQWRQRDFWRLQGGLPLSIGGALLGFALLASVVALVRGTWPFHANHRLQTPLQGRWQARWQAGGALMAAIAATFICVGGITALLMSRQDGALGLAYSMLLGWLALWLWMLLPGRLNMTAALGIVLLAIGMLVQLEQGLGADESFWLRYFQRTTALAACALGAGALLRLWLQADSAGFAPFPTATFTQTHTPILKHKRLALPSQHNTELVLAALAISALLGLLLQVLFGSEAGVFDIQPVEFAKTALVVLTAHVLALRIEWQRAAQALGERYALWLRLIWPALLLLALSALALVQLSDYSPLILLLVWGMASALTYATAARSLPTLAVLIGIGMLTLGLIVQARHGADAGASTLAASGFYADRFAVWLHPALHPYTGQQFLQGAQAIADGGWWGADALLGLSALGMPAGSLLQIPAVQDDFSAAFFMNRHGLIGALVLWGLQALFIIGLLHDGWRAYRLRAHANDFRQAWFGRFCCFTLCGGAGFVFAQVLLSWGTNVAIFPVMGQPMSFLSAGGSHLLFFLLPLLCFDAVTVQSIETAP
jgi:cell division protein FtsW